VALVRFSSSLANTQISGKTQCSFVLFVKPFPFVRSDHPFTKRSGDMVYTSEMA